MKVFTILAVLAALTMGINLSSPAPVRADALGQLEHINSHPGTDNIPGKPSPTYDGSR